MHHSYSTTANWAFKNTCANSYHTTWRSKTYAPSILSRRKNACSIHTTQPGPINVHINLSALFQGAVYKMHGCAIHIFDRHTCHPSHCACVCVCVCVCVCTRAGPHPSPGAPTVHSPPLLHPFFPLSRPPPILPRSEGWPPPSGNSTVSSRTTSKSAFARSRQCVHTHARTPRLTRAHRPAIAPAIAGMHTCMRSCPHIDTCMFPNRMLDPHTLLATR